MRFSSLGDRMKFYEKNNSPIIFPNVIPVVARIDGKAFHSYTKQCQKPYDEDLHYCMTKTMHEVCESTGAKLGYTQSDEISLLFWVDSYESEYYFGGKRDKINSVVASMTSVFFNKIALACGLKQDAFFDCRSFWVPNKQELVNYIIWREQDAVRNSIQMLSQSLYSHKELQGKNKSELHEMCFSKGFNWNDLDQWKKNGTFYINNELKNLGRITSEEDLNIIQEYIK